MIYRSVTVTSPLCGDAVEILSHSLSLPLLHMDFRFSFQNLTICFRCLSPNLAFACFTLWINSSIKLCISLSSIVLKYTAIKKRQIPQYTSLLVSVQCSLTYQRKVFFFSQPIRYKTKSLFNFHRLRVYCACDSWQVLPLSHGIFPPAICFQGEEW